MRLVNCKYDLELNLSEEKINVVCIENRKAFSESLLNIWNQQNGMQGTWILSEAEKELNISKKLLCIINPFAINCNDRRLQKVLYQELENDIQNQYLQELTLLNGKIVELLDEVICNQSYALEMEDQCGIQDILKLYNVKFCEDFDSLATALIDYIKLMHQVLHIEVFVFANLKAYLTKEELNLFYESVLYKKVYILLIENVYETKNFFEKVMIFDKDMCIIDLN